MNKTPDFTFDRTLEEEELKFWSNFFDHFPFNRHAYTQALISYFSKTFITNMDIDDSYKIFQEFQTKKDLINHFQKDDLSPQFKEHYPFIIEKLDLFFPNSTPIQLFLMSLYCGSIQNMNFEISAEGVHFLPTDCSLQVATYVPELAFMVDFMGQRANEIFSNLNLKPVKISGEFTLKDTRGPDSFIFQIEGNSVKRYVIENEKPNFEFAFDFSKNSDDMKNLYSPLHYQQTKLLRAIQDYYLRSTLAVNSVQKNKIKI